MRMVPVRDVVSGAILSYKPDPNATDAERLASVETIVMDMHRRLFGNGQPGELTQLSDRITKLESWFWRCVGGAAVIVAILERVKG